MTSKKPNAKYTIDPCKACYEESLRTGDFNINTLNNCLTETWAAYNQQFNNTDLFYIPEEDEYRGCMNTRMNQLGKTSCQLRLNPAAVFVNDPPHYFPTFLHSQDPDKAYQSCIDACEDSSDCVRVCKIDKDALVSLKSSAKISTNKDYTKMPSREYFKSKSNKSNSGSSPSSPPSFPTIQDVARAEPTAFWITFIIIAIIFAFVLTLFFIILFAKLK